MRIVIGRYGAISPLQRLSAEPSENGRGVVPGGGGAESISAAEQVGQAVGHEQHSDGFGGAADFFPERPTAEFHV